MTTENASLPKCPLWRRLAAALYDAVLLFGMLGVATTIALPFTGDLGDGRAHPLFSIYLFMVSFFFFGWFWTHGGQTLGMKTWRIRVVRADGSPLGLRDAALRYGAAALSWLPFGLGFWWALVNPARLAWHDRLSGTRLVRVASPPAAD